jgi:DNA-binding NarL/FixJ family response regulator
MMKADHLILVGIIEDDSCYAKTLKNTIQLLSDLSITGVWPDAETALLDLHSQLPDILLMDTELPRGKGIDCIRRLKMMAPELKILVMSGAEEDEVVFDALKAGASGYLLKEDGMAMLIKSIRDLEAGGSPMSGRIARKLVDFFNNLEAVRDGCSETLTRREQEVLTLLADGKMYKEISVRLGIAMETTKKHMRNIYSKLQVQNRTEAINKWRLSLSQYMPAMAS